MLHSTEMSVRGGALRNLTLTATLLSLRTLIRGWGITASVGTPVIMRMDRGVTPPTLALDGDSATYLYVVSGHLDLSNQFLYEVPVR